MFKKIATGLIEEGKAQRVFLMPFAKECKVYENYEEIEPHLRETLIPLVLMQLRWDGKNGFAGGIVEKGEDLRTALIREAEEEFALVLDENMLSKVKPLSTYSDKKCNIHSFIIEVDYETIKLFQKNSFKSKHFLSEVTGCSLPQIADFKGKGIKELLKNNFSGTAKQELLDLIEMEELVSADILKEILQELSLDKIELKSDNGKYKGRTGELITLKEFLNIMSIDTHVSEGTVQVVYDKELPENIIGIKVDDTDCPHGEVIGQMRFIPYKLNNCFMYQEEQ
jgi:ADP-ribose pyrophosphatase